MHQRSPLRVGQPSRVALARHGVAEYSADAGQLQPAADRLEQGALRPPLRDLHQRFKVVAVRTGNRFIRIGPVLAEQRPLQQGVADVAGGRGGQLFLALQPGEDRKVLLESRRRVRRPVCVG